MLSRTWEMRNWNDLDPKIVALHTSEDGIVDHYSLFSSLHHEYPIHFAAFKQHATCLSHEANTESRQMTVTESSAQAGAAAEADLQKV